MARRLPNSSQVSKRNQHHVNAVRVAHARELRSTLAEESSARIHQLLEPVPRSLHRKLQIHIQATSLTRGTAGMQTWNEGGISDESAIDAFRRGLQRVEFKEQLGQMKVRTLAWLLELANSWADGEDSVRNETETHTARSEYDYDGDEQWDIFFVSPKTGQ